MAISIYSHLTVKNAVYNLFVPELNLRLCLGITEPCKNELLLKPRIRIAVHDVSAKLHIRFTHLTDKLPVLEPLVPYRKLFCLGKPRCFQDCPQLTRKLRALGFSGDTRPWSKRRITCLHLFYFPVVCSQCFTKGIESGSLRLCERAVCFIHCRFLRRTRSRLPPLNGIESI